MKNHKGLVNVNMIRPAVFVGRESSKLRIYPPTESGRETLFFLMITLQRNGSWVPEKDVSELRKIHSHNYKFFLYQLSYEGRSPGEGTAYSLQYSGLENSMDCIVHGGCTELDMTK